MTDQIIAPTRCPHCGGHIFTESAGLDGIIDCYCLACGYRTFAGRAWQPSLEPVLPPMRMRTVASFRAAARRLRISYAEYTRHREAGERWCCFCQTWHPESEIRRQANGRFMPSSHYCPLVQQEAEEQH